MYSINHALIAIAATGAVTTNPVAAFFLGVLSHFLVDMIPHGDTPIAYRKSSRRFGIPSLKDGGEGTSSMIVELVGTVLLIGVVLLFFFTGRIEHGPAFAAGIVGGIFPDMSWGAIQLLKLRWMFWFTKLHHKIHNTIPFDYSFRLGVALQGILAVIIFSLLYF